MVALSMTEIRRIATDKEVPPTNAGKFLARRGHIVMKQYRAIGKLECDYFMSLTFSTMIFSIAHGSQGDTRLE